MVYDDSMNQFKRHGKHGISHHCTIGESQKKTLRQDNKLKEYRLVYSKEKSR